MVGGDIVNRVSEPFLAALCATMVAQAIKGLRAALRDGRTAWVQAVHSGGMPSAHSALAVALFFSVALQQGWSAAATGIAGILAIFILYDAAVLRQAASEQARAINLLLERLAPEDRARFQLRESLGHTRKEVAVGALVGFAVSLLVSWLVAL